MSEFAVKHILVTCVSRGIGFEAVKSCVEAGAEVTIT